MFGMVFVSGQVYEFTSFYREGLGFTTNLQSSAFYVLTGFHGVHVFVGLTILTLCYIRIKRAHDFSPKWATPLQAGSVYWHFVDVVWIILYLLVYIL